MKSIQQLAHLAERATRRRRRGQWQLCLAATVAVAINGLGLSALPLIGGTPNPDHAKEWPVRITFPQWVPTELPRPLVVELVRTTVVEHIRGQIGEVLSARVSISARGFVPETLDLRGNQFHDPQGSRAPDLHLEVVVTAYVSAPTVVLVCSPEAVVSYVLRQTNGFWHADPIFDEVIWCDG